MIEGPLCYRMEYSRGSQVSYVEWVIGTDWGMGYFTIRRSGNAAPVITFLTEDRQAGWLKKAGHNAFVRHAFTRRMYAKSSAVSARMQMITPASIEQLEAEYLLDKLFSFNSGASNAWKKLTGLPVGQSFEEISIKAAAITEEVKAEVRKTNALQRMKQDELYGIF